MHTHPTGREERHLTPPVSTAPSHSRPEADITPHTPSTTYTGHCSMPTYLSLRLGIVFPSPRSTHTIKTHTHNTSLGHDNTLSSGRQKGPSLLISPSRPSACLPPPPTPRKLPTRSREVASPQRGTRPFSSSHERQPAQPSG